MNGRVTDILEQKGYFWITGDDGVSYFAHKSQLVMARWEEVRYQQLCEFEPTSHPKGPRAERVRLIAA